MPTLTLDPSRPTAPAPGPGASESTPHATTDAAPAAAHDGSGGGFEGALHAAAAAWSRRAGALALQPMTEVIKPTASRNVRPDAPRPRDERTDNAASNPIANLLASPPTPARPAPAPAGEARTPASPRSPDAPPSPTAQGPVPTPAGAPSAAPLPAPAAADHAPAPPAPSPAAPATTPHVAPAAPVLAGHAAMPHRASAAAPLGVRAVSAGPSATAHALAPPRASSDMLAKLARQPGNPAFRAESPDAALQVARGLAAALRRGDSHTVLRLAPESLGQLRIDLRVEEGAVTARLDAEHDSARRLLAHSLDDLRSALEARGLRVERIDIEGFASAPHPDAGSDQPAPDPRAPAPQASAHAPEDPGATDRPGSPRDATPATLLRDAAGILLRLDALA